MKLSWNFLAPGRIRQKPRRKRKFLYVAMMSADKFVDTRVKTAAQTWASSLKTWNRDSGVDVEIFAQSNYTGIPHHIVKMPGISDNVYPPQKKSFSMMRYVHDHKVNDYEWFLRLDDDAYVHIGTGYEIDLFSRSLNLTFDPKWPRLNFTLKEYIYFHVILEVT